MHFSPIKNHLFQPAILFFLVLTERFNKIFPVVETSWQQVLICHCFWKNISEYIYKRSNLAVRVSHVSNLTNLYTVPLCSKIGVFLSINEFSFQLLLYSNFNFTSILDNEN